MDILLGPEDRDALYESNPRYEASPEAWEEAICRAQVRKVTKWLETNPETDIDAGTLIALRRAGSE